MPTRDLARRLNDVPRRRLPREVRQEIDALHQRGLRGAARLNAAAYVTHVAMTYAGQLSAEEARLIQMVPLGEARYQAIVDTFASVACAEVAGMKF
jgi:hypothetical protein